MSSKRFEHTTYRSPTRAELRATRVNLPPMANNRTGTTSVQHSSRSSSRVSNNDASATGRALNAEKPASTVPKKGVFGRQIVSKTECVPPPTAPAVKPTVSNVVEKNPFPTSAIQPKSLKKEEKVVERDSKPPVRQVEDCNIPPPSPTNSFSSSKSRNEKKDLVSTLTIKKKEEVPPPAPPAPPAPKPDLSLASFRTPQNATEQVTPKSSNSSSPQFENDKGLLFDRTTSFEVEQLTRSSSSSSCTIPYGDEASARKSIEEMMNVCSLTDEKLNFLYEQTERRRQFELNGNRFVFEENTPDQATSSTSINSSVVTVIENTTMTEGEQKIVEDKLSEDERKNKSVEDWVMKLDRSIDSKKKEEHAKKAETAEAVHEVQSNNMAAPLDFSDSDDEHSTISDDIGDDNMLDFDDEDGEIKLAKACDSGVLQNGKEKDSEKELTKKNDIVQKDERISQNGFGLQMNRVVDYSKNNLNSEKEETPKLDAELPTSPTEVEVPAENQKKEVKVVTQRADEKSVPPFVANLRNSIEKALAEKNWSVFHRKMSFLCQLEEEDEMNADYYKMYIEYFNKKLAN